MTAPYGSAPIKNLLEFLSEDAERVLCRMWRPGANRTRQTFLAVVPAAEQPRPATLDRLAREFGLKEELERDWAIRPLALERERARTVLVLEDPGGEPLERLCGLPMEVGRFLRLAIAIAAALGKVHQAGLVHNDIKPANIFVNGTDGQVRFTGFGLASRQSRERQATDPPEVIAGTLAYMAPERTGRINRAVDSRSDLYSLGITFYEMLTGSLPFTASDPMDWVHYHIAREPPAPAQRLESVPATLSAIVMKLLAKSADERYQSAAGLEYDLRRCLADWESRGRLDDFALGVNDTSDRLLIPEKLYGRERELRALLAAFGRVAEGGRPELVLVSGDPGIGKSSLVNALLEALVPARGLFASGKFDQYKRDIPYSTLVQAFQLLVKSLLGTSDTELAHWHVALADALGANGRLITDLIPELKLIIGEPPPLSELEPQQAQRRFQRTFRHFIGVFARPEHPLALFLDDLQWLDAATLELLEDMLIGSELRHLLLIGAYRDNEVDDAHPLRRKLAAIAQGGAAVEEITLPPLGLEHVESLITDALRCERARAAPLARLVYEQTAGNPFFLVQFLDAIAAEGMLAFNQAQARWSWDVARIHARGYTENVVDLMVEKLSRLPPPTQKALQQLACLGAAAEFATIAVVLGTSEEQAHAALADAVRQKLIEPEARSYRFVHDRVQEAAYSLIPGERRVEAHLLIGRILMARTPPARREEVIFDIVNHLNRGVALIAEEAERVELAELNLIAGKRAKAAAAYASALAYASTGAALLTDHSWQHQHTLVFELALLRAECAFLTGALTDAEQGLAALSARAANTLERASVACVQVLLYITLDQSSRAIAVGLDYLGHLGIHWSPHPSADDARREYREVMSRVGGLTTEKLIALPAMTEPASLATLDVLTKLSPAAFYTDVNLVCMIACRTLRLTLEHGNSDASAAAYVRLGMIGGMRFGDYDAAYRFGEVGYELVERRGLARYQAEVYMNFGIMVSPWKKHIKTGLDLVQRAAEAARNAGNLVYAAFCSCQGNTILLTAGDPLAEVQRDGENALALGEKVQVGSLNDFLRAQLGLVRTLRGLTPIFGCLADSPSEETRIERQFGGNPEVASVECWYWIRKLQARFLAGDYAAALDASAMAERLLGTSLTVLLAVDYHFYSAITRAASCDSLVAAECAPHLEALGAHHRQLQIWAESCPENFAACAGLVAAEVARLEGRELEAERLYEEAIRAAGANGFVQHEALANELAARFYDARGFAKIAHAYLRDARYAYLRWGADGKVRQLEELYPRLRTEEPAAGPTGMIGVPVEHLDLATVIKVSQAVSSEIVLEKLISTLMSTAIAQAGAERGLLILTHGTEPRIRAEAATGSDTVAVQLRDESITASELPESVLHYVLRTQETLILDDAAAHSPFGAEPYIRAREPRSILCVPLLTQAKLIGALYLENRLTAHVFAPSRVAVLKLLASQAAISLENARLYRGLAEREAQIRRLVEANIIGIFIWTFDGSEASIVDSNDAFLRLLGYDREDLAAGRLGVFALTPPEWLDRNLEARIQIASTGTIQPYEKEYLGKDGRRVPVLIGSTAFDERCDHGVTFVVDLTERKRAEAEARESERRYREVQGELAHANRVATIGQLTASIAHEVNQPIAATINNAQAALRWLRRQPPDLQEVEEALAAIVNDGKRAGEVIGRIRALIKKAPAREDSVSINDAILEVVALTHGAAVKAEIAVQTRLAENLPLVRGDRVGLQQVILNLIVNAIEAMTGGPDGARQLSISTEEAAPRSVLVAVRDSGPGLARETLERLFDSFYTTKLEGLGLGLSICRSIVEAHGGRLWASANEPRGALFQFTVPLAMAEAPLQSEP